MSFKNKELNMTKWLNFDTVRAVLLGAITLGTVYANEVEEKQEELSNKIDSIEKSQIGVSFGGVMRSRMLGSEIYGNRVDYNNPTQENHLFSQLDFTLKGRPSTETEATLIFRLHQDYNNYYDEGVNPFNTRWMSYDGTVFNDKLEFHIGDFRLKRSPLVTYAPGLDGLEFEPEFFTRKRQLAESERFLVDNQRHLQGFNATWTLGDVKGTDFQMSGTAARLRFPWWSNGILQYDNDDVDKYLMQAHGNLNIMNLIDGGASFTAVYDRIKSSRSHYTFNPTATAEYFNNVTPTFEDNFVTSFWVGADLNQFNPKSNLILNARADVALSNYQRSIDTYVDSEIKKMVEGDSTFLDTVPLAQYRFELEEQETLDGFAFLGDLSVGYQSGVNSYILNAWGIFNDENFVSDLAQSQNFMGRSIFNTNQSVSLYGNDVNYNSMFDAMYNYAFVVSPTTDRSNLETSSPVEPRGDGYNGTNNYYRVQYEKNSYTGVTMTKVERDAADAGVFAYFQQVLPNGKATANRAGGQAELDIDALDNAISFDAYYGQFANVAKAEIGATRLLNSEYTRFGAGSKIRLGGLLNYNDGIELSAGYGRVESDLTYGGNGLDINSFVGPNGKTQIFTDLYSAGLKVGFATDFEFIGGFQYMQHDFEVSDVTEMITGLGLGYQITRGTSLTAEIVNIYGESENFGNYNQMIPQANLTMVF